MHACMFSCGESNSIARATKLHASACRNMDAFAMQLSITNMHAMLLVGLQSLGTSGDLLHGEDACLVGFVAFTCCKRTHAWIVH